MIKILFFIETLEGGGAEKVLCNLVNNMDQTKFDITVQTIWPSENQNLLHDGIKLKSCFAAENRMTRMALRIQAASGWFYRFHIHESYDIEVAYLESISTKVISMSPNKKSLKLAWVHCDIRKNIPDLDSFYQKSLRWYRKYDTVIGVSENVRDSFTSVFGKEIPTAVLTNTIDDIKIRNQSKEYCPDIATHGVRVVAIGRLSPEKGNDRLLRVAGRIHGSVPNFTLQIIGEGPQRPELEDYISKNQMESYVQLLGFQKNPYPYLNAADLLVCPSYTEGFSTVVAEGLILGKTILTTECSGMRELLGNSEYGMIVENSDAGLQEGLRCLLMNENIRAELAQKVKERSAFFSAKLVTERTERFMIEHLEEKRHS